MPLHDKEKATLHYYDTHADEWIAARRPDEKTSYWNGELDMFHDLMPSGKVLEIGPGSGREASKLIEFGYDYTGVDASQGLLAKTQCNVPEGKFFHQSVYDLNFPRDYFDGFWTAATLLHIPKNRINEALRRISRVTKTEGLGFISLKKGEGESVEDKTGRFFSYYMPEEFVEILHLNAYSVLDTSEKTHSTTRTTWLSFFVKNIGT